MMWSLRKPFKALILKSEDKGICLKMYKVINKNQIKTNPQKVEGKLQPKKGKLLTTYMIDMDQEIIFFLQSNVLTFEIITCSIDNKCLFWNSKSRI